MGRRTKSTKGKAAATRTRAGTSPKDDGAKVRALEKRLAGALEREAGAVKRETEALGQLQTRNRELAESREQQTATSDILRVISQSPTSTQPVFDAIVTNAARLCEASQTAVCLARDALLHLDALHHAWMTAEGLEGFRRLFPMPINPRIARTLQGETFHIADITHNPAAPEGMKTLARHGGYESMVWVPLMRGDEGLGLLSVVRATPRPFDEDQIAVLRNFADQAVIAIENVRLFTELQEKNQALTQAHAQVTETLEQQTATAEILRVISSSPTDAQPVFDTIVQSAVRLCNAANAAVFLTDGQMVYHPANFGSSPEALAAVRKMFPRPLDMSTPPGIAILRRSVVQVPDIEDPSAIESVRQGGRVLGFRSVVMVPMLREGEPVGALGVARREPGRFSDAEVGLLTTFADQAVIAIENVRSFTELQTSNRELTTALDTQTATSDILRVISRSQTDVQPVFDAILASAVRLLGAYGGFLTRIVGNQIELVALKGPNEASEAGIRAQFPLSLQSVGVSAQAIRDRGPINIVDYESDSRVPEPARVTARLHGYRSWVVVPILHHADPVGTILIARREPGGFTDDEIALLQTFADQAVIAIDNARLLTELQARTSELTRSVGELRALGEVGQAISSTLDLQTVLSTIVARATELAGVDAGVIYEYDEQRGVFVPRATAHLEAQIVETMLSSPVRKGEGVTGRLAEVPEPIQVPDILEAPAESRVRGTLVRAGYRALLAVPLVREDHLLGGLTVLRKATGAFTPEVVELLQTFATQSALAIQNARLFLEIEDKSRRLEAASRHKSAFLANMSHELRTPLNAIIGYSELLQEEAGDLDGGRLVPDLQKIATAAKHQLSLINDILDLSKIEAGRMELELSEFDLPNAIENALILVRERASRRGIRLGSTIDERLGMIGGDERKVKQVLLNLLSNALKFTPEGGRIDVRAGVQDKVAEVSVTDTGVGIAPEDQEAVFEEFRQVGTADKKVEGTGLGLALSRKFIELHGGRIWVTSAVGVGSTFTFTLPVRREE